MPSPTEIVCRCGVGDAVGELDDVGDRGEAREVGDVGEVPRSEMPTPEPPAQSVFMPHEKEAAGEAVPNPKRGVRF